MKIAMKPICILDTNKNIPENHQERWQRRIEELQTLRETNAPIECSFHDTPQILYGDRKYIMHDIPEFDYMDFRENFGHIQETDPLKYELLKGFAQTTEYKQTAYSYDTLRLLANQSNDKILTMFEIATNESEFSGMLRLGDNEIPQFLQFETERLKKLTPIAHLKNEDGVFIFKDEDLFACAKLEEKQLAQVQDIAPFGFSPKQIFAIIQDETINKEALVKQLKKISAIFDDKLEDTQLIKTKDPNKYILRTNSNNMMKGSNDYKTIQILVNRDIEPISMSTNVSDLHSSKSKNALQYRIKLSDIHAKTQTQLQNVTPKDVEKMAQTVAQYIRNSNEKEIYTVMQRLTQFASYDSLAQVQKSFSEGHCFCFDKQSRLNSVFNYLQLKSFMDFDSIDDNKIAYILNSPEPSKLNEALTIGKENIHFMCLDAFDDGITIFNDRDKLVSKTIDVLKRAKHIQRTKHCSLDEALDLTLNKNVRKLAREHNITYATVKTSGFATAETIAKQLNTKAPSFNDIDSIIGSIAKEYAPRFSKSHTRLLMANYLHEVIDLYSPQRLVNILKNRKSLIEKKVQALGKAPEDIRYVILDSDKSYNLITYMYTQTNNIDPRHIIKLDEPRFLAQPNPLQQLCEKHPERCFVILDDIFGSGDSIIRHSQYENFEPSLRKSANIIFSPISLTGHSKQKLQRLIKKNNRTEKDFIIVESKQIKKHPTTPDLSLKTFFSDLKKIRSYNDFQQIIKANIAKYITRKFLKESGYKKGLSCTLFPYMAPDNNSKIGGIFLSLFANAQESIKTTCKDMERYRHEADVFSLIRKFRP